MGPRLMADGWAFSAHSHGFCTFIGCPIWKRLLTSPISSTFRFSQKGDEVVVESHRQVELWSTATWQRTKVLTNFMGLLFAPAQEGWWLTSDYRSAGLYSSRTQELLLPLPIGTQPLAVSPDGRYLAVSVDARKLQVWDLAELRRNFRDLGIDWEQR